MIKIFENVVEWWDSLSTTSANPATVRWILLVWFVLCVVVLYKCE